tara:strand:+ start:276 stop:1067 length:792 start_codon:yes stop_codon:yes gene_type:complete
MTLETIIILSLVQGITEFLPISSSAHLIVIPKFFLNIDSSRGFDVSLHLGSLLAVIYYLKKDLMKIISNIIFFNKDNEGLNILKNLIVSTIPIIIVGFLVHINNFNIIRSLEVIGWTTLIFGILLGIADKNLKVIKFFKSLNLKDALIIGIAQTLAIVPGTSRSGIVITAGLWMGFSRFDASKYSLLLSIPVIIAATTLESINLFLDKGFFFNNEMIVGIILSFCVAYITIRLFMNWINKASLKIFVAYRIILGILILVYAYI